MGTVSQSIRDDQAGQDPSSPERIERTATQSPPWPPTRLEARRQMSPPDQGGGLFGPRLVATAHGYRACEPRHATAKPLRTKSTRGCVRLINKRISSHGQLSRRRDGAPRPQAAGVQPTGRGCRGGGEQEVTGHACRCVRPWRALSWGTIECNPGPHDRAHVRFCAPRVSAYRCA